MRRASYGERMEREGFSLLVAAIDNSLHDRSGEFVYATSKLQPFVKNNLVTLLKAHISDALQETTVATPDSSSDSDAKSLGKDRKAQALEDPKDGGGLARLKDLLCQAADSVGLDIHRPNGGLCWTVLPDLLANESVYINNYPDILMPHETRKTQTTSRGIKNLTMGERRKLIKALESREYPCQFIRLARERKSEIQNSQHPLIIFAPTTNRQPYFWKERKRKMEEFDDMTLAPPAKKTK
ncbi:hypothetical protein M378DRAFT_19207 [Amanita muscaria Koide BX008]|uniref:Uncharacterized protein n=1 Tax=Amanita muscaria (strain Koide BX008) TaxID=946122 RepID=A0A0C2WDJ0_AMAMK|nr:hypothetical protein M378DRAFT_19207 [Amanita muscaria Koide BX008]